MVRYCAARPFPPYTYVTGLAPHPTSDPAGHSFGLPQSPAQPLAADNYRGNQDYLYALDLFNHGYYWEAHEAWESLWHAAGRHGLTADFLKGLIKLAAAGVKLKEGRPGGVRRHAERAAELLRLVQSELQARERGVLFGLALSKVIDDLKKVMPAADDQLPQSADAARQLPIQFDLE